MNRIILFSPVGGTDPIPQTNIRDGSLLHICRVYKPTDVYLYMSSEIHAIHKQDNRYCYCLERLAKLQQREMQIEVITRPNMVEVQLFDTFYVEFRDIIRTIAENMDETDQLLLNVSSGTPAMKSSLIVLATMGEYPYRLIQVTTPTRKMNEHKHADYDVATLWELNEDNEENFENRCHEIQCPTLSLIKQEEIIKQLVHSYDYQAAIRVCDMLPEHLTGHYKPLLETALLRLQLEMPKVNKRSKELGLNWLPITNEKKQIIFEYALSLDVKRRKGEYADFIRAITPLLFNLYANILRCRCSFDISAYSYHDGKKLVWDERKLSGTEADNTLQAAFRNSFNYGTVYSYHLSSLILSLSDTEKLVECVKDLRCIEQNVRNIAAHEIVALPDERIKKLTDGFTTSDIMNMIKEAFRHSDVSPKPDYWDSYDKMNEYIIQKMEG